MCQKMNWWLANTYTTETTWNNHGGSILHSSHYLVEHRNTTPLELLTSHSLNPPFTDQILFLVFIQMSSFIIHLLLLVITSSLGPSQRALTGLGTCVPGDSRPMEKSGCWKSSKCDVLNFKDKIYKHMVIMCIYIYIYIMCHINILINLYAHGKDIHIYSNTDTHT